MWQSDGRAWNAAQPSDSRLFSSSFPLRRRVSECPGRHKDCASYINNDKGQAADEPCPCVQVSEDVASCLIWVIPDCFGSLSWIYRTWTWCSDEYLCFIYIPSGFSAKKLSLISKRNVSVSRDVPTWSSRLVYDTTLSKVSKYQYFFYTRQIKCTVAIEKQSIFSFKTSGQLGL